MEKRNIGEMMTEKNLQRNDDRPREECGVFAVYGLRRRRARPFLVFLPSAPRAGKRRHRHGGRLSDLGTQGNGPRIRSISGRYPVPLPGRLAIGHVRYSTTGSSVISNAQPFLAHYADEYYALGHNGNLINAHALRAELEDYGAIFQSTMDSEVFIHLMAPHLKKGIEEALIEALAQVQGSYSLVILTRNKVIAARDPRGFRPFVLAGSTAAGWWPPRPARFDLVGRHVYSGC